MSDNIVVGVLTKRFLNLELAQCMSKTNDPTREPITTYRLISAVLLFSGIAVVTEN